MFFAGSIRSVRMMSLRSPTTSSSSAAAPDATARAASSASASGSGPSGVANDGGDRRLDPEHRARRRLVGLRPPRRVEAGRHRCHRPAQVDRDVGRQHADRVGAAERRVGEVEQREIGPRRAHHPGHQRELVVVHHHGLARRRLLDHGVGEGRVHRDVRVPRGAEVLVEPGATGKVEQAVVQEPQRRVGHDVVVQAVERGIEGEEVQVEAGNRRGAGRERGGVAVVDGRRDPRNPLVAARVARPAIPASTNGSSALTTPPAPRVASKPPSSRTENRNGPRCVTSIMREGLRTG